MIIDKSGRQIKPGQMVDVAALSLMGAMCTARVVEVVEPSGLMVPKSVAQEPPYIGITITLKIYSEQVPNLHSPEKVFLCHNTYIVREDVPKEVQEWLKSAVQGMHN